MATYAYFCVSCGWQGDQTRPIVSRDLAECPTCGALLSRRLSAPLFKIDGKVTPGGGPDKFTADMLRIPLHDLPDGLKVKH